MATCDGRDNLFEAGSIWTFLDNLHLSNPEEYKRYIDKIMKEGEEQNFGPPVAKFVVETYKTPKVIPMRKYFINIGEWRQVPKPESDGTKIPILAAEPRKELIDKEWAMVIDIVLNPCIFIDCTSDIDKCTIVELVLKCVEDKNGFKLTRKYKFVDEKYKGNPDHLLNFMCPSSLQKSLNNVVNGKLTKETVLQKMKHLSRKDEMNDSNEKISEPILVNVKKVSNENRVYDNEKNDRKSEIIGARNNNDVCSSVQKIDPLITATLNIPVLTEQNTKTFKNTKKNKLKTPKVEMEVNKEDGNVELTVYLPDVESVQECDLELKEDHLSLTVFKKYELEIDLPVSINIDESKAKFVKDLKILLITASINVPSKES